VNNTFQDQLKLLVNDFSEPENNQKIQERFVKAIAYFSNEFDAKIKKSFKDFGFSTDNKSIEKDITKHINTIEELITIKQLYFEGLKDAFNVKTFLELRTKSVFLAKEKPKKQRKTVIDGTTNVELFELLRELRNTIASTNELIHFQVFTQKALYEMCETLPTNKKELMSVNGMGKVRVEKYGSEILKVIHQYCDENDIQTSNTIDIFEVKKPKKQKGDTKKISLDFFKVGKSVDQIALERELNKNTIVGHLASFIPSGEIKITDLISKTHYKELKEIIPKHKFENLSDLKHQIDNKYTFSELRLVLEDLSNQ